MNQCDYDHETAEPTRLLPIGGSGNVIVCRAHYNMELAYRRNRNHDLTGNGGTKFELPTWDSLKLYEGAK